jgi:hypothetical protein
MYHTYALDHLAQSILELLSKRDDFYHFQAIDRFFVYSLPEGTEFMERLNIQQKFSSEDCNYELG